MNTALLKRLEDARWGGRNDLTIKISELDAMVAEVIQLRTDLLALKRAEEFTEDEKLVGFLKLESLHEMRQNKIRCCRLLKFQRKPFFTVPVFVKLSALQRLMQCQDPSKK